MSAASPHPPADAARRGARAGHGTALFPALQRTLESIYEITIPHAVEDFVVTDEGTARALDSSAAPRAAPETLFIRESADSLDLSLYVDESIVERLRRDDPRVRLHGGNFADFCVALEGVSHFIYVVYNASHGRSVSLLELELQAEVDKFAAAAFQLGRQNRGRVPAWLHEHLFERAAFDPSMDASSQRRYRTASDYAAHYCRRLNRRYLRDGRARHLVNDLRRFYRLTQRQKIRNIAAPHQGA